jgi:hypothetical protein
MYLYHYPDIWYDYATWHAQNGSLDSAAVIFQRALTALPGISITSVIITGAAEHLSNFSYTELHFVRL